MRVLYPTTPSQYFHILRRQAHVRPERPMVVMTPKSLLRLPAAASPVSELVRGGFRPVLDDPSTEGRRDRVKRLILCTGKVYHDLIAHGAELLSDAPRTYAELREYLKPGHIEGIVWHHPDGRMVKIKAKDFGIRRASNV